MLTCNTVCTVLFTCCVLQATVSALPTDSNRKLASKNIHRFVPKSNAALAAAGSASIANGDSGRSEDDNNEDHEVLVANKNNEDEEHIGETHESNVEEYQCTDSHSSNPNPIPKHTHIRKKIIRRRIKKKANNAKKKVKIGSVQGSESEQDSNLNANLAVSAQRNGNNYSKNQKQATNDEESDNYEDSVTSEGKTSTGKEKKQINVKLKNQDTDKMNTTLLYNENDETEEEEKEDTEFLVGEENETIPQKQMIQNYGKAKNKKTTTNTQSQNNSSGKNKYNQEEDVENEDENGESLEEVECKMQHLNYTKAHTHMRKRANNIPKTDDRISEEDDTEENEEEENNTVPNTEDVKPHKHKRTVIKGSRAKTRRKPEESIDEETSVNSNNKNLKKEKEYQKIKEVSSVKAESENSPIADESPGNENKQFINGRSVQQTSDIQQKSGVKQITADDKDENVSSKLGTRSIKDSNSPEGNEGDGNDLDDDDEEEVEEEECTVPHNESTTGHKHTKKKSIKKENKSQGNKNVTVKRPKKSKNTKLLTNTEYDKPDTKSVSNVESQDTVDEQVHDGKLNKRPTNKISVRKQKQPEENNEIVDNKYSKPSSRQNNTVKTIKKKEGDDIPDNDDDDDEEEEEEVDEEECILPHTKDTLPHKHTRKAGKNSKPDKKSKLNNSGTRQTAPVTNIAKTDNEVGEKKKTNLRNLGSVEEDTKSKADDEEEIEEEEEEKEEEEECLIPHGDYTSPHTHPKNKLKNQNSKRKPAKGRLPKGKNNLPGEQFNGNKPQLEEKPLPGSGEMPEKNIEQSVNLRSTKYPVNTLNKSVKGNGKSPDTASDIDDASLQQPKLKKNSSSNSETNNDSEEFREDNDDDDEEEEDEEEECVIPHNENTKPHKHTKKIIKPAKRNKETTQDTTEKEKAKTVKDLAAEDSQTPEAHSNIKVDTDVPQGDNKYLPRKTKSKDQSNNSVDRFNQQVAGDKTTMPYKITNKKFPNKKGVSDTASTIGIQDDEEISEEDENSSQLGNTRKPLKQKFNKTRQTEPSDTELNLEVQKPQTKTNTDVDQIPRNKPKPRNNAETKVITDTNNEDLNSVAFGDKRTIVSPSDDENEVKRMKSKPYKLSTKTPDEEGGTKYVKNGKSKITGRDEKNFNKADNDKNDDDDDEEEEEEVDEEECVIPHNDSTGPHKHTTKRRKGNKTLDDQKPENDQKVTTSKPSQYPKYKPTENDKRTKFPSQETDEIPAKETPEKYNTLSERDNTQTLGKRQTPRTTTKGTTETGDNYIEQLDTTTEQLKAPKGANKNKQKPKGNAELDKTSDDDEKLEEYTISENPSNLAFSDNRKQPSGLKTKPHYVNTKSIDDTTGQSERQKSKIKLKNTSKNKVKPKANEETDEVPENDSEQPEEDLSTRTNNKVISTDQKDLSKPNQQGIQATATGRSQSYGETDEESPDDDEEEEEVEEEECIMPHDSTTGPHKHTRKRKTKKSDIGQTTNDAKQQQTKKPSKQSENIKRSKLSSQETDDTQNDETSAGTDDSQTLGRRQTPRNSETVNNYTDSPDVVLKQPKAAMAESDKTSDDYEEELDENTIKNKPNNMESLNNRKLSGSLKTKPNSMNVRSRINNKDDTERGSDKLEESKNEMPNDVTEQPKTPKSKNKDVNKNKGKPKINRETDENLNDDSEKPEENLTKRSVNTVLSGNKKATNTPDSLNSESPNQQETKVIAASKSQGFAGKEDEAPNDDEEVEEEDEENCTLPHNGVKGPHKHTRKRNAKKPDETFLGDEEESEGDTFKKPTNNILSNNKKQAGNLKKKPTYVNTDSSNQKVIAKYQSNDKNKEKAPDDDDDDDNDSDEELEEEECTIPHDNNTGPHKHMKKKMKVHKPEGNNKTKKQGNKEDLNKFKYPKENMETSGIKDTGSDSVSLSEETNSKPSRTLKKFKQKAQSSTEEREAKLQENIPDESELTKTTKKNKASNDRNKGKPQKLTDQIETTQKDDTEELEENEFIKSPNSINQLRNQKPSVTENARPEESKAVDRKPKSPNEERINVTTGKGNKEGNQEEEKEGDNDEDEEEIEEEECTVPHNGNIGPHTHTKRKHIKNYPTKGNQKLETDKQVKTKKPSLIYWKEGKGETGVESDKRGKLPTEETYDLPDNGLSENDGIPLDKSNSRPLKMSQKPVSTEKKEVNSSTGTSPKQKPNRNKTSGKIQPLPGKDNAEYDSDDSNDDEEEEEVEEEECTIPHNVNTAPHKHTRKNKNYSKTGNKKKSEIDKGAKVNETPENIEDTNDTEETEYGKRSKLPTGKSSSPSVTKNENFQRSDEKKEGFVDENDGEDEEDEEEFEEEVCRTPHTNMSGPHKHLKKKKKTSKIEDVRNPDIVEEGTTSRRREDLQTDSEFSGERYDKRSAGTNQLLSNERSGKSETQSGKHDSQQLGESRKPARQVAVSNADSSYATFKKSKTPKGKTVYSNDVTTKTSDIPSEEERDDATDKDSSQLQDIDNESDDDTYKQPKTPKRQNIIKISAKPNANRKSDDISGNGSQYPEKSLYNKPSNAVSSVSGRSVIYGADDNDTESPDDTSRQPDSGKEGSPDDTSGQPNIAKSREQRQFSNNRVKQQTNGEAYKPRSGDKTQPEEDVSSKETRLYNKPSNAVSPVSGRSVIYEADDNDAESPDDTSGQPDSANERSPDDTSGQKNTAKSKKQRQFSKSRVKQEMNGEAYKPLSSDKKQPKEDVSSKKPFTTTLSSNEQDSGDKRTVPTALNKRFPNQQETQLQPRTISKSDSLDDVINEDDDDDEEEEVDEEECVIPHDNVSGPHKHTKRKYKNAKLAGGLQSENKKSEKLKTNTRSVDSQMELSNSGSRAANEPNRASNDYTDSPNVDKPGTGMSGMSRKQKKTKQTETIPGLKSTGQQNNKFNSTLEILPYKKYNGGTPEKYEKNKVEGGSENEEEDDEEEEEEEVEEEECIIPHTSTTEPHKHTKSIAKLKEFNKKQKLVAGSQYESPQKVIKNKQLLLKGSKNIQSVAKTPESDETDAEESLEFKLNSSQKQWENPKKSKYVKQPEANSDALVESIQSSRDQRVSPSNLNNAYKTQNSKSYETDNTVEANGRTDTATSGRRSLVYYDEDSQSYETDKAGEDNGFIDTSTQPTSGRRSLVYYNKDSESYETDKTGRVDSSAPPTSARRSIVYPQYHDENNNNCYGSAPSSAPTRADSYKSRKGYNENQKAVRGINPRTLSVDIGKVTVKDPKDEDSDETDTDEGDGTDSSCKQSQNKGTQGQSKWSSTFASASAAANANSKWKTDSTSGWPSTFFSTSPFMSNCKPQPSSTYSPTQPFMYHNSLFKNQKFGQQNNKIKAKSWSAPGSYGGVKCKVQTSSSGPSSIKTATYKHPFIKKM